MDIFEIGTRVVCSGAEPKLGEVVDVVRDDATGDVTEYKVKVDRGSIITCPIDTVTLFPL